MLSRSVALAAMAGSGMVSSMKIPWSGEMPQVTDGAISAASITTTSSYRASASEANPSHFSAAFANASPCGTYGRPRRNPTVVASGFTYPQRAPPSIDMLQTVIRSSIEKRSKTSPAYS